MTLILYASALIRHTLAIILASLMSVSVRFNASQIFPPYHLVGHHALMYSSQNRKLRLPINHQASPHMQPVIGLMELVH